MSNTNSNRSVVSLTIAPVFLCASIYICLNRLMTIYAIQLSRLHGRKFIVLFILSDFTSLLLQTGGGSISVVANDYSTEYIGIHLMIAGLGLQVLSLVVVLCLWGDFAYRCWRRKGEWEEKFEDIRKSRYFKGFLYGLFTFHPLLLRKL